MKAGGGFCWLLWMCLPLAAHADLRDSANWARLRGCPRVQSPTPLLASATLQQAASRLAGGTSLHSALSAVGYVAALSTAVHLSGVVSDAQVGEVLAGHYCSTLTDANLHDVGAERRGREVWLIFAAPAPVPTAAQAAAVAREILELTNRARATGHRCGDRTFGTAAPLAMSAALTRAALSHSREMAAFGEFEHRGHNGSSPAMRVERAGYGAHRIVGENIAAGAMTAAEVMQGWLASPPHCENLMDPRFTEIGIAFGVNRSRREIVFWTEDLAAPGQSSQH